MAQHSAVNFGRFVLGLGVLLLFQLLGSWLVGLAHAAVPGSVVGMMLLAAALHVRLVPIRVVRPTADFLVRHLALLYVPAGVSVMLYAGLLRQQWVAIAAAALTSLIAVLLVVGATVQRLERDEIPHERVLP
ncbi:MAG: CidA/LrgA family protein [Gemmatimonadaceae bacterium]